MTNPKPARLTAPAAAAACADAIQRATDVTATAAAAASQDGSNLEYIQTMYLAIAQAWLDLASALAEKQAMNPLPPVDGEDRW